MFDNINSIAIIGASKDPKKLGYSIVKNLIDFGFKGIVYPINLNGDEILGIKAYKNLLDITSKIDLVVIAIPADKVSFELEKCVEKSVPLVIIISAGFKEIGAEGLIMEEKLKSIVKGTSTKIIGPNCLGIMNFKNKINVTFAKNIPTFSPISFITQSGALGTAFLDWISENNLGIDKFVSIGNKVDLDENTFLEDMKDQKLIVCYLEDIKDGKKLMEIGYKNNKTRPVLILSPGKTDQSKKAISSHTGSLAGSHDVISAGLKQSGYIEVNNIGELFNKIKLFTWSSLPKDEKVAIITNAGGPAVIATDLLIERGMNLAEISDSAREKLSNILPKSISIHNPLDVIGDALADRYLESMKILLQEDSVSSLLVILTPQIMTEIEKTAKYIGEMKSFNKPIVAAFIGGKLVDKGIALLAKEEIPAYHFPETAIESLSSLVWYSNYVRGENENIYNENVYYKDNHSYVTDLYLKAKKSGLSSFVPSLSEDIAKKYGILTPLSYTSENEEILKENAYKIGYPVALKISSPNLMHKSDIGGIVLNIQDENKLVEEYKKLEEVIQKNDIRDGLIEVQQFINTQAYFFIGAKRDANFGTVIVFGYGGIYTEIIKDISRRITPLNDNQIRDMIYETKISNILKGIRGGGPFDENKIIKTIRSVISIMDDYSFISSIDINPLIIHDNDFLALDVKIYLDSQ